MKTMTRPYWCGECGNDWPECSCYFPIEKQPPSDAEHADRSEGYPRDLRGDQDPPSPDQT